MAWTSMHFAVGMCGGAVLTLVPCVMFRRGWRYIPVGMTLGGLWGLGPDLTRLWREDFTSLPFASTLGSKELEVWLNSFGDLFFFHQSLDAQPKEYALLGLAIIIGLYNLCLAGFIWQSRRNAARLNSAHPNTPTSTQSDAQTVQNQSHNSTEPHQIVDQPAAVIGRIERDKSA